MRQLAHAQIINDQERDAREVGEMLAGERRLDHGLALELGLAFHIGPKMLAAYSEIGIDLNELYGGAAGLLPVPATFVVRSDGIIDYAFVDPDFRLRAEPANVVRIVASLTR